MKRGWIPTLLVTAGTYSLPAMLCSQGVIVVFAVDTVLRTMPLVLQRPALMPKPPAATTYNQGHKVYNIRQSTSPITLISLQKASSGGAASELARAKPIKMSLNPHPHRVTYWSRITRCKILKLWSFLQSKAVNSVCKLLQLLGTQSAKLPTGTFPLDHTGDFRPLESMARAPSQWNFLAPPLKTRTCWLSSIHRPSSLYWVKYGSPVLKFSTIAVKQHQNFPFPVKDDKLLTRTHSLPRFPIWRGNPFFGSSSQPLASHRRRREI